MGPSIQAFYLKKAPYQETLELQERLRARVLAGGPETLLFCQHPPVLTVGRGAAWNDIRADGETLQAKGVASIQTGRGGRVTYHGPGQLVVYPIVRLRKGVVAHVQWLAAAAIEVAAALGVQAEFHRDRVGVWVGSRKLAAIGVHVSHRVAIHGLALNVLKEASAAFEQGWFVPCGIEGGRAISLQEALPKDAPGFPGDGDSVVEGLITPFSEALCQPLGWAVPRVETLISPDLFVK